MKSPVGSNPTPTDISKILKESENVPPNLVLFSKKETADLLGVSSRWLDLQSAKGLPPQRKKVGRLCKYSLASILEYLGEVV